MPRTLVSPIAREGIGLHTGQPVRVTLAPAPAGTGRVFRRAGVEIPALAAYVVDTRRCTALGHAGVTVHTVEHVLAALLLAGVDDVVIAVDGPELPALDGAAQQWYEAIQHAGVCAQQGEITRITVNSAQWVDEAGGQFFLSPAEDLRLFAVLSIPDTVAVNMVAGGALAEDAVREQTLRARTYGLLCEVEALLADGLAQGGTLENAVVLTETGYLNPWVWPDEPAWHKVLDLAGDLALLGARLQGQVVAIRAGHRSHVALAKRLLRQEMPVRAEY